MKKYLVELRESKQPIKHWSLDLHHFPQIGSKVICESNIVYEVIDVLQRHRDPNVALLVKKV